MKVATALSSCGSCSAVLIRTPTRRTLLLAARAASGQATAPLNSVMISRRFSRRNRIRSPPDCAGLQHIDLATVSQRVRQPFYNRAAGCTAHPRSAPGQNLRLPHRNIGIRFPPASGHTGRRNHLRCRPALAVMRRRCLRRRKGCQRSPTCAQTASRVVTLVIPRARAP